jgi:hypothetical protein
MLEAGLKEVVKIVRCVKTHVVSRIQIVLTFLICYALFDTISIYQNNGSLLFNLSGMVNVLVVGILLPVILTLGKDRCMLCKFIFWIVCDLTSVTFDHADSICIH